MIERFQDAYNAHKKKMGKKALSADKYLERFWMDQELPEPTRLAAQPAAPQKTQLEIFYETYKPLAEKLAKAVGLDPKEVVKS